MKIKCITNKTSNLPQEILQNYKISYKEFSVKEGIEYTVYALGMNYGYIWYCICDNNHFFYPEWNPSPLFEIVDNRLSRYWVLGLGEDNSKKVPLLSFPEWTNDEYFYGELVDGNSNDPNAIIFKKYKELMDLEFSDSSITETAQIGDEEWLICPKCLDAWQSKNNQDALVKCPKCQQVLNNPRYKHVSPGYFQML